MQWNLWWAGTFLFWFCGWINQLILLWSSLRRYNNSLSFVKCLWLTETLGFSFWSGLFIVKSEAAKFLPLRRCGSKIVYSSDVTSRQHPIRVNLWSLAPRPDSFAVAAGRSIPLPTWMPFDAQPRSSRRRPIKPSRPCFRSPGPYNPPPLRLLKSCPVRCRSHSTTDL